MGSTCTTGASTGGAGATSGRPGAASTVTFAATSGAVAACATVLSGGVGVSLAACTAAGSSWGFLRSQPNRPFFSPVSGVFLSSLEPNMGLLKGASSHCRQRVPQAHPEKFACQARPGATARTGTAKGLRCTKQPETLPL